RAPMPSDLHSCPTRRSSDLIVGGEDDAIERLRRLAVRSVTVSVGDLHGRIGLHDARHLTQVGQLRLLLRLDENVVQLQQTSIIRDRKSTRLNSSHVKISYAV